MEKAVSKIHSKNHRYERKFIYPDVYPDDLIETEILVSSFCFREIFNRRTVNNCYFDDSSMSFYHQNVAGDDKRSKYRLRWYGDDFSQVQNPVLEIKKKHGLVGDKISFPLKNLNLDLYQYSSRDLLNEIKKTAFNTHLLELESAIQMLKPSLYNSYERRYFLSDCERFRITVDYNMQFYDVKTTPFTLTKAALPEVILELKYAIKDDKASRKISQGLRARLSKHSKYVRGVDLIYHQTPG
jgi:SPX domain protein involved in polyphosphate accumulation